MLFAPANSRRIAPGKGATRMPLRSRKWLLKTARTDTKMKIPVRLAFFPCSAIQPRRSLLACLASAVFFAGAAGGCARPGLPPVETARERFAEAASAGDSDALWNMLTARAKNELNRKQLQQLVKQNRRELQELAEELRASGVACQGRAEMFLRDGRRVQLTHGGGTFWVRSAGLVPAPARSPEQAAQLFRQAVESRNLDQLQSVLSGRSRRTVDRFFYELDSSLELLQDASSEVSGDHAEMVLPNGRRLVLTREAGSWRVEAFH